MINASRALAAAGCGLLAVVCLALGYRHAEFALAVAAMEHLDNPPAPAEELARVGARLQAAAPDLIPATRYQRGRWLVRRATAAGAVQADDDFKQALEDFRWVTMHRPTWAAGWVGVVSIKARLHANDTEFHHALKRALATGPNESKSFNELFPWLRLRWHWLDESEKGELLAFTVRAAWREPKWVVEQAERYYFLDPVCRRSGDNRLAMAHCRRLGWTPDGSPVG